MNGKQLTDDQKAYLIAHYANTSSEVIAAQFGISLCSLYNQAAKLGLRKSKEYVASVTRAKWKEGAHENSRQCHYSKGSQPFNKGKKQAEFMTAEAIEASKRTRFKKGDMPANSYDAEFGVITIRRDKTKRDYQWIKMAHGKWRMLHVALWESENGPVPAGHILVFKDKNTMNTELSNIELITRSENMRRNTIHQLPEEIKTNVLLVRSINRKLRKLSK